MSSLDENKNQNPALSFVIVNRNTERLLVDCIGSILKNKTADEFDCEIWLVDNGSSDRSVETVRRLFPAVKIIEAGRNLGFAKANNLALSRALGRYAVLLNTDAALTPDSVKEALSFMDGQKDAAVLGAQLLNADGSRQNSVANTPCLLTELANKSLLRLLFPHRYPGKEKELPGPAEVESVIGAFMAVRMQAIEDAGPMDEDYFFFLEETDWCFRFREKGWKVYHHPGVRVFHLQGQSAGENPEGARIEYWRSRYLFFRKHRSLFAKAVLRTGLFLKLIIDFTLKLLENIAFAFSSKKRREKLRVYTVLLIWHLAGCPEGWGLAGKEVQATAKNR